MFDFDKKIIKYRPIAILNKMVTENDMYERQILENNFLVSLFLPFNFLLIIAHVILTATWNINPVVSTFFTTYLLLESLALIYLNSARLHPTLINNCIHILLSFTLIMGYFVYYSHLTFSYWIFYIAILLPNVLSLNYNGVYYLVATSSYTILLIFLSGNVSYDQSLFGVFLIYFIILSAIFFFISLLKYLFISVIEHQFEQFSKVNEKNEKLEEYSKVIKENNKELEFYANRDPLTKLYNRHQMTEIIQNLKVKSTEEDQKFAFIYIDLNDFKNVNDTQGHNIGDLLLVNVAEVMKKHLPHNYILGRLGGDEFAIIIQNYKNKSNAYYYLNKIIKAMEKEIYINNRHFKVTASFGVAIFPDDTRDINELISAADTAMYNSKADKGINISFFAPKMHLDMVDRLRKESLIDVALDKGEFYIEYQPFIDNSSDKIVGYEALIRWKSAELGFVPPLSFISIAESIGKINDITRFVLEQVCQDLPNLNAMHQNDIFISVNVSPTQFNDTLIVHDVLEIINKYQTNTDNIILEVTESAFIKNPDTTLKILNEFKKNNLRIAIDDFGTGYASLEHLLNMPFDILKIDKAFVKIIDEENQGEKSKVVDAIIDLARSLNMRVVAEGVETEKQVHYLKQSGCDVFQGYYYSNPLSKDDIPINKKGVLNESFV